MKKDKKSFLERLGSLNSGEFLLLKILVIAGTVLFVAIVMIVGMILMKH